MADTGTPRRSTIAVTYLLITGAGIAVIALTIGLLTLAGVLGAHYTQRPLQHRERGLSNLTLLALVYGLVGTFAVGGFVVGLRWKAPRQQRRS